MSKTEALLAEAVAIVRQQLGETPADLVGRVFEWRCREHEERALLQDDDSAPALTLH